MAFDSTSVPVIPTKRVRVKTGKENIFYASCPISRIDWTSPSSGVMPDIVYWGILASSIPPASCPTSYIGVYWAAPSPGVMPDILYRASIHPGHSRCLLSGIHLLFISDGSPLPTGGDDGQGTRGECRVERIPTCRHAEKTGHARHFVSGIHLGSCSDRSRLTPSGDDGIEMWE